MTPQQAEAQRLRIRSRYEGLKFEPPAKAPDTSRNAQRGSRKTTRRRTIL